jgi:tetratricopeptide (TPR) repeat protein
MKWLLVRYSPQSYRGFLLLILVSCFIPMGVPLYGQNTAFTVDRVLIHSDPLGAALLDDQNRLLGVTPLVIPFDTLEEIVTIEKIGYQPISFFGHREIQEQGYGTFFLIPEEYPVLPTEISEKRVQILSQGEYELMYSPEGTPLLRQRYPRQALLEGVELSIPLFATVLATGIAYEMINPRRDSNRISFQITAGSLLFGGLLAVDAWLQFERMQFHRDWQIITTDAESTRVGLDYQIILARELRIAGDKASAAEIYRNILEMSPDSVHVSEALFSLGQLALQSGDVSEAIVYFSSVIDDFPAPRFYDLACKNLADSYLMLGDPEAALEALDAMLYIDPSYPPRIIELYRQSILNRYINS